jgi:hypothetical protein
MLEGVQQPTLHDWNDYALKLASMSLVNGDRVG